MRSYNKINLGLIIKMRRAEMGLTQQQLASKIGIGRAAMNAIEKGHSAAPLERVIAINKIFGFNLIDNDLITKKDDGISDNEYDSLFEKNIGADIEKQIHNVFYGKRSKSVDLPNNKVLIAIDMIEGHDEENYITQVEDNKPNQSAGKFFYLTDKENQGEYLAWRIRGDAMNDGSLRSIPNNSIVVGRKIKKELWFSKLSTNQWKYFLIVHKKGIIVREISTVYENKKSFLLQSLNDDKEYYPDYEIKFEDCIEIYIITLKQVEIM